VQSSGAKIPGIVSSLRVEAFFLFFFSNKNIKNKTIISKIKITIYIEKKKDKNQIAQIHKMQAMRGYQQNANEGKDRDFLVIAPDHSGRVAWDLFCMAIIVYELIMIPMLISFEPLSPSSFSVMDSLSPYEDIIFMTDIFLNFNTACYR
jgi:hypothetical protein